MFMFEKEDSCLLVFVGSITRSSVGDGAGVSTAGGVGGAGGLGGVGAGAGA